MVRSTRSEEDRGAKAFRAMLALYPAAFRDEYGREVSRLFMDRYRHATGPWDRATLWLDVLTGLAVEAPKEHGRMILQDLRYALRTLRKHSLGASETEPAALQLVSSSYFQVLGVRAVLGQLLPDENARAPVPLAVLSHRYWQRRFGGLADVLGRTLTINGSSFTIAGVAPRGFAGVWLEAPVDVWVPITMDRAVKYSQSFSAASMCQSGCRAHPNLPWFPQEIWWLDVIVRAPAEQTAAVASAFNGGVQGFMNDLPGAKKDARMVLEPFANGFSAFRRQFSTPLFALIAMAALVLLIACANVANLLLARAAGRQREIAVRMSLAPAERALSISCSLKVSCSS